MLDNSQIEHDSQKSYFRLPVGAAEADSMVKLGLRITTHEEIKQVLLRLWVDNAEKLVPMHDRLDKGEAVPTSENHFYAAHIHTPECGTLVWYYFIVTLADGTIYYGNNAEQWGGRGAIYDHVPPSFQLTVYDRGARTPDWFKHAIMYQIFPDRFYRSGSEIIPKKGAVYHACWQDDPCYYKDPDTKEIVAYDFFGGNLKGIEQKLGYLDDLGIDTIYLNPVFESESNHHYDTGDYKKIDPILGTNEDFHELVQAAKKRGMHIILDGVFSHTGSNSRYFNRYGQYDTIGAYQAKDSPYYEWYNFRNFPNDYECWWNFDTLPDVKETTPSYMDFIIRDKDSVLHHWMKEGIAGWRLDVIDELPAEFSQTFFKELKATDPDAVMIGEVWEDASNKVAYGIQRQYLCGHEMDSAMNYPFRDILFDYLLGHIDAHTAMRRFESLRENYPRENFYAMMNLIGSHDVQRAITLLGEAPYYDGMPAIEQSRYRLDSDHYNLGLGRLLMAALWQMTYPGVPCIYYGDEIAMQGFKDPYNRRPYDWEHGDSYVQDWYRKMIKLRKEHVALQTGELLPLYADDGDVIAYARRTREEADIFGQPAADDIFIIAFNRHITESRAITLDVSDFAEGVFFDPFHPERETAVVRGKLTLELKPLRGQVLEKKHEPLHYARQAGILLHPTSLPSKYGCGDLGKTAYRFIDWLASAGQSVWQILPLGPVGLGYSPYQSPSAFAGNTLLIDIDELVEKGWLKESEARMPFAVDTDRVDFDRVAAFKEKCLRKAYVKFAKVAARNGDYQAFIEQDAYWLDDYALFMAAHREFKGGDWTTWPEPVRKRDPKALAKLRTRLADGIGFVKFTQYLFHEQWERLHAYAKARGIRILGDIPIFLAQDSADVWANQSLFDLNEDGTPHTVAGVPPDYFSATGQLWGNPQYDWKAMRQDGYAWWKLRLKKLLELVDMVRIDHFRGFESYWEIPGGADTAMGGTWRPGPGLDFFKALKQELGDLPIVAEDLGIITDAVEQLRSDCGFPGMKVLQFMLHFGDMGRFGFVAPENSVIYTGTHDNNTTVGWYEQDIDEVTRAALADMLHADIDSPRAIDRALVEYAYASEARLAIIPMQDVLGLDAMARMNAPGTVGGNWSWCLKKDWAQTADAAWLQGLARKYGRSGRAVAGK